MNAPRRVPFALLLALCCAPGASFAQASPEEVNFRHVSEYQATMERACKFRGLRRGESRQAVDAYCACTMQTLRESVSLDEWRKAYYLSVARRPQEEVQVIAPHLPKLEACRK